MVKRILASVLLAVALGASSARAQGLTIDHPFGLEALPTAGERKAADIASWATVGTLVVLDLKASFDKCDGDSCYHALVFTGLRVGATYGAVFVVKSLLHRERPCAYYGCGSDNPNFSMPSGHTALAFSTLGGPRLAFMLPLSVGTGGLRVAAGKHYLTDTVVGALIGLGTSRIR